MRFFLQIFTQSSEIISLFLGKRGDNEKMLKYIKQIDCKAGTTAKG